MAIRGIRFVSIGLFALLLVVANSAALSMNGFHKIVADPGVIDEKAPGVQLIADYGTYRLYRIADDALGSLPGIRSEGVTVRDDMDVIQLDAYPLDTREAVVKVPPALMAAPSEGAVLHLVQFVGPVRQQWLDELTHAGMRPVQYIESNAYLVWADGAGRQVLDSLAAQGVFVQYSGPYHPYYKLGPTLREPVSQPASEDRLVPVTIQILDHEGSSGTQQRITAAASSMDSEWEQVLSYLDVRATVPLSRLAEIAGLPDVTWIGERLPITRNDDKQGQIVAGHFNAARTGPSAPGYKPFLDSKGFSTNPADYPIVGLSDDGVGNGSTINGAGDPTFTKQGDGTTTRLAFVQNCTTNALGNGLDGHGHINTSIVGGYDVRPGNPYQDVDGYQRGMGMNPYGRMGMTKIFANGGSYSISNCGGTDAGVIASSYGGGARISSNSWGCSGCSGTYDASSQAYDAGTRDALPGTAGNQEYLFVFSAGNTGPGAATVGTPGNGKNMITVAASENDRPGWTDGCAIGATGADNAMDVISFSSRGPSPGGRKKPEVIAPGTHIQGTASTDPGYNGSGVCDQYMPTSQTIFAASSGTSHAAPAVAGTASLYYRWLQDHFLAAVPSPALLKAYMLTHTTYLTGTSANDTLPSNAQGYGMPNLEMALDDTPRYLVDQSVRLDNSGDSWVFHGFVADASKPVRIVMVYTDAPGAVGTSPQVNNLNLQAVVGASTYNGNVFSGQYSVTGGSPDAANNYEAVYVPAGTTGAVTITVNGFNIAGDGVPNTGDATDQDFALVCYNCATCAGSISTDHPSYSCNASIAITLGDRDLTGLGSKVVTIRSTAEPTPENVTLNENPPNSGVFVGSFPTTSAAPLQGDGAISVVNGDTVTIRYLDASACGIPNVTVEQTAAIDCQAPVISNVQASNVTGNSANILWDTNEPTNSGVTYGAAPPPPGITPPVLTGLTTSHNFPLTGLSACTPYVYSVASTDASSNSASDNNGGAYYAFTTGVNVQPTYSYPGPSIPIPDNSTTGATATIVVPDNKPIVDLNVTIGSITHTFDGDLTIHVIAPDAADVVLSNKRGGSGDNFVNTVFDDAASTTIASGTAPFTGSFKPDNALSAFNGKIAAGTWTLFVVDSAGTNVGTLGSFSLNFTYPAQPCGPHAIYGSHVLTGDQCSTGAAGAGNGVWEPGEQVQFKVTVDSDGTTNLTGVSATVVSTTPGVTMVNGTASYPNVAAGASSDSNAPHFTVNLPTSLACGSTVGFQLTVNANEGSWTSNFTQGIGQVVSGGGTALDENFSGGIPAPWTVVNGGTGGGAAATWTTANPGARAIAAPMVAPTAIIDSDNAGGAATQDEELITPVMSLATATTVTLDFDQYFRWYGGGQNEICDVDVKSSLTGSAWVNVLRQQGASSPNPDHKTLNLTAQAAGAPDVQIRFHYYQASYDYYWQVDNVKVTYTAPVGCNQTICAAPPTSVKPVPDGSFGAAMTGSRVDPAGTSINVTWDVTSCLSTGYHILYGNLATVASYAIGGSACAIGTSGSYGWSGVPAGNLWFVVAADDGTSNEGSWGTGVGGAERGGTAASGQCGMSTRDNSGTCP